MSESTPRPPRRPRYAGKNPRRFAEKYKEHQPGRYVEEVGKIIASGKTPAGMHRPILVQEILEVLALKPGDVAVDCTLGYGGHAKELLKAILPGGKLIALDADPIEMPRTVQRMREAGFGEDVLKAHRSNFAAMAWQCGNCRPTNGAWSRVGPGVLHAILSASKRLIFGHPAARSRSRCSWSQPTSSGSGSTLLKVNP